MKPWSQEWLIAAGAYPGFCSMKRVGVFLLPLDGMLAYRMSLPQQFVRFSPTICRYPFILLSGERHCESKVSCSRTQHSVPGQRSNPDHSLRNKRTNHEATTPPTRCCYTVRILSVHAIVIRYSLFVINNRPISSVIIYYLLRGR